MTKMLEKAFAKASTLAPKDQDAIADWLLQEIESESTWKTLFDGSQDALSRLASEALEEHQKGQTHPLDPDHLQ